MEAEIKKRIKGLPYEEALQELDGYISAHPDDDEALTQRGLRHWGAGKRSLAINDFLAAVRLNPASPAAHALVATKDILDYRNKDLYNP